MVIFVYLHIEELDRSTEKPLIMATFMFVSDGDFWEIDTGIDIRKGVKGKEYSLPMVLCILRTI